MPIIKNEKNIFLLVGACLSSTAASLHITCIYFGGPLFRFLGTEKMAKMYDAGNYFHPIIASLILATILLTCSTYALSGAGIIRRLPFLRLVLTCITLTYLARGSAFPFIIKYFPGNSMLFWYCSSSIIFSFGVIHFIGLKQVWTQL